MRVSFQHLEFFRIKSDTLRILVVFAGREIFSEFDRGIQLSLQIWMFWPLFTLQMVPFFNSSSPCSMPFQVGEEFAGKLVSSRFPCGKYFAFSNLAHRLSGNYRRCQACLARSAWLKRARSRKPMPPLSFGLVILSQASQ
jgi:hypothetical protein